VISNLNNPTVRQVRRLRKRRERERRRTVLVEGNRALAVALSSSRTVRQVLHTKNASAARASLLREARAAGATVLEVTTAVMESLTSVATAPDILSIVDAAPTSLDEAAARFGLGTVLAGVHDPATAGSILACCAAAGGSVAVATRGTTDLFAPKSVRSAAGAHFRLAIAGGISAEECARALRTAGVRLVALRPGGDPPERADLTEPLAVLVGEDGAIPPELADAADATVSVGDGRSGIAAPVAAQAAVVLFEAARRRGAGPGPEEA
jgi:RNA methyltransferase, TrmH family